MSLAYDVPVLPKCRVSGRCKSPERFGVWWHFVPKPKRYLQSSDVRQKEFQRVLAKEISRCLVEFFKFDQVLKMVKSKGLAFKKQEFCTCLWPSDTNFYNLARMFWSIHRTLPIIVYSDQLQNGLNGKNFTSLEDCNGERSSLPSKIFLQILVKKSELLHQPNTHVRVDKLRFV